MHAHSTRAAADAAIVRAAPPSASGAHRIRPRLQVVAARTRRTHLPPPRLPHAEAGGGAGLGGSGGGITWDRPLGAWDGDDGDDDDDAPGPLSRGPPPPSLLPALAAALATGGRVLAATLASAATVWADCVYPRPGDVARLTAGVLGAAGGLGAAVMAADAAAACWYGRAVPAVGAAVEAWVPGVRARWLRLEARAAEARAARVEAAAGAAEARGDSRQAQATHRGAAAKLNKGLVPVFAGGVSLPDAVPVARRRRRVRQARWSVFEALG